MLTIDRKIHPGDLTVRCRVSNHVVKVIKHQVNIVKITLEDAFLITYVLHNLRNLAVVKVIFKKLCVVWLNPVSEHGLFLNKLSLHFKLLHFFELDVYWMFSLSCIKLKVEHSLLLLILIYIVKDATIKATLWQETCIAIYFLASFGRILSESSQSGESFSVNYKVCLFTVRKVTQEFVQDALLTIF